MKRKALKGLLILLCVLVICFFFSGTVKTLTTAKVKLASVQWGKLKSAVHLTGYLTFSQTEGVAFSSVPEGVSFTVGKVYAAPGAFVQAGETLFDTEITGLEEARKAQESALLEAEKELLSLERQYAALRLTRNDQAWLEAYDTLLSARQEAWEKQIALNAAEKTAGPDSTEYLDAQAALTKARQTEKQAQSALDRAARAGISEDAYQYTMRKRELEETVEASARHLTDLKTAQETMGSVRAEHDCYVVEVLLSPGDTWDGLRPTLTVSAENADCILRAALPDDARPIAQGTAVLIAGRGDMQVKAGVTALGYDKDGKTTVDVTVKQEDVSKLGAGYRLMRQGANMTVNWVSDSAASLLPAAAVRGSEGNGYVFTVSSSYNAFGQRVSVLQKQSVEVLDAAGDMVALNGLGDMMQVAYMEDRNIAEGSEVMEYE